MQIFDDNCLYCILYFFILFKIAAGSIGNRNVNIHCFCTISYGVHFQRGKQSGYYAL